MPDHHLTIEEASEKLRIPVATPAQLANPGDRPCGIPYGPQGVVPERGPAELARCAGRWCSMNAERRLGIPSQGRGLGTGRRSRATSIAQALLLVRLGLPGHPAGMHGTEMKKTA
jgi:hypothetical protein